MLLSSNLGNPERRPLTTAQLRVLADRAWKMELPDSERDLEVRDFLALGYNRDMATRIVALLSEEDLLEQISTREDILRAMNRMSSMIYILMIREKSGR